MDNIIKNDFDTLNTKTQTIRGLPENFQNLFNFYYYSDPGDFADAFNGCAGTLPEDFYEDAPLPMLLSLSIRTMGARIQVRVQPDGCTSTLGLGINTWLKAPAQCRRLTDP